MHNALFLPLVRLLAPHYCLGCSREGVLLCTACANSLCERLPERCFRCGQLSELNKTCKQCRRVSPLGHVWAATTYTAVAEELIRLLKFARAQAAAHDAAQVMAERLPQDLNYLVTFAPTASSRARARGYDQARLIASELAHLRGWRVAPLLVRTSQTRQLGARRLTRQEQMHGAFRAVRPHLINGATILIVDDVLTTGATLNEAGRVLRDHSARRVDAAVFAQVL